MENHIDQLRLETASLRQELIEHPIYSRIRTVEHLRMFLQHHVFAVWDFMSLLKSLQRNLTCTEVPWVPKGSPNIRYLINEIVLGEESDVDEIGNRVSHFELYLQAMHQAGADTTNIDQLIADLKSGIHVADAIAQNNMPLASARFSSNTFSVVDSGKTFLQAAVFTFGREDLIPGMFLSFVNELNKQTGNGLSIIKYYLVRHIQVDGDLHSHLGYEMTSELCGQDAKKWAEATMAVKNALQARIALWDAILECLERN